LRKADNLPPSSVGVTESGSLNLSEHSGPHRAVMGMLFYVNERKSVRGGTEGKLSFGELLVFVTRINFVKRTKKFANFFTVIFYLLIVSSVCSKHVKDTVNKLKH
jgi:hypothetical protein